MYAIEIENLYKSYDGLPVLNGLNLRVPQGQVYGLLGPNGSGKSTLIHLLLGFLRPTRGTLRVFGQQDLEQVRGRIGYLPERLRYHLRYSGREYLRYLGQFSDLHGPQLSARVEQELGAVGLLDAADRQLATYSKGMLQRLGIAQALLSDPDILLIDEHPPLSFTSDRSTECYRNWWSDPKMLALMNHSIDLMEELADESGNV